jgi:hypothetical protein
MRALHNGPGRKHCREIALESWQDEIVQLHRREFLRGLFHSDGCRVVASDRGLRSIRYHFSNASEDIKKLYCNSLNALAVTWTRPCERQIAVYRRNSVDVLESFLGPKE